MDLKSRDWYEANSGRETTYAPQFLKELVYVGKIICMIATCSDAVEGLWHQIIDLLVQL